MGMCRGCLDLHRDPGFYSARGYPFCGPHQTRPLMRPIYFMIPITAIAIFTALIILMLWDIHDEIRGQK